MKIHTFKTINYFTNTRKVNYKQHTSNAYIMLILCSSNYYNKTSQVVYYLNYLSDSDNGMAISNGLNDWKLDVSTTVGLQRGVKSKG